MQKRYLLFCTALVGILLYNNWLFGILVNWTATRAGATISELSVPSQHWSLLFRACDVVAGVLLIASSPLLARLGGNRLHRKLLYFCFIGFAASNIFDAISPLQCASTLSHICAVKERAADVGFEHLIHLIESPLVYSLIPCIILLIMWAARRRKRLNGLRQSGMVIICLMAAWVVDTIIRYEILQQESIGYEQRIITILFSAWLIAAFYMAATAYPKSKSSG